MRAGAGALRYTGRPVLTADRYGSGDIDGAPQESEGHRINGSFTSLPLDGQEVWCGH